ncbi:MAG: MarR family winged helix-turn-helix transcriptional regulator [Paraburkholderia fungorum]|nr:MarR family winged helix-turn-helix transcriptional regulator [Paraburkholderia fungorum]
MKTNDRLLAVDASAKDWREGVPEFSIRDVMLMRLIRVASLGITALTDPVLRPTGLTESSYHTLIVVLASGAAGTTPSVLCEQLGQNRANMTRIIDLLKSEKLIRIGRDTRDARRRHIVITPSGSTLVRTYAKRFQPILRTVFGTLAESDKRALNCMLRNLIGAMDAAERLVQRAV